MDVPSMVRRSGDKLIVRQVVSGQQEVLCGSIKSEVKIEPTEQPSPDGDKLLASGTGAAGQEPLGANSWRPTGEPERLPQCKVKRNYSCPSCSYFTQNPRRYLRHLRDTHGEKIIINECKRCLYASKHHQKLVRHMRMVHGSEETDKSSSFVTRHRRAVKREYPVQRKDNTEVDCSLGLLATSELDTNTYTQQLVASDFPRLLEQLEKKWSSSIAANIELVRSAFKIEMDNLHNVVNVIPEEDAVLPGGTEKTARRSLEGSELTPRKRHRPIPNLIPLASPPTVAVRPEKELLKPVPMSVLMPQDATEPQQSSDSFPVNLPANTVPPIHDTQMKCTFCELSYDSTVDLANHIEAAHKEDLFTSLLQKSIDDSQQNLFPQSDADSASSELWKTLLEANFGGPEQPTKDRPDEPDGKQAASANEEDDVEILENKTETYCGIETAPGYGEVTSKIPSPDSTASAVTKKVFKCPHCSFWASTASRFHVHIVGHLNKKPFECSLCSYRSNWRWDITKHIRLKTIRDPSHKTAGVLMNDETGRRNYTKYNKYITLMQIADNSAKDSSSYAKSFAESTVSDLMTACSTYNIDLNAFANIPGFKLLLEDKQINEEVPTGNGSKQYGAFHLKCNICEFRTSSKEELLLHTTSSHTGPATLQLDDVIESEPSNAPASVESNTLQARNCTLNSVPTSGTTATPVSFGSLSKTAANTSGESPTNGTLLTTSGAGDKTNPMEQGEGEGSSNRVAMPTWRHNAPYRCGHCHQVSNWKHVIQRHCRLKHNGNVLIEHINSEKDDPSDGEGQTQQSTKQSQHSFCVVEDGQHSSTGSTDRQRHSTETTTIPPPLAPFILEDGMGYTVANTLEPIVEILDKDPSDFGPTSATVLVNSGTVASAVHGDQLDCVSCQFHADTAEQLTEHLEAHISNGQTGGAYNIAPTTLLDPVPTVMYFCSKCPARFFDESHVVEHEERHGSGKGAVCPVCSYVTTSEEERTSNQHPEVHSAAYNKNTENLQIFLAESTDYPKPQLTIHAAAGQQVWCVEATGGKKIPEPSSPKKLKRSKQDHRHLDAQTTNGADQQLRSIFLCEYCDNAFDAESDLNTHVRNHFSAILSTQSVAYYTSLGSTLNKEKRLELVVSGSQSTLPLHYVYDNTRRKEWAAFSKTDSVLLKL